MPRQIPIGPLHSFARHLWHGWQDLDALTRCLLVAGILMWAILLILCVAPAFGASQDSVAARGGAAFSSGLAEEPRGGGAPPSPLRYASTEIVQCRFRVTAYCPCAKCCGQFADGFTATGTRADHPLVAAPPCIPFGTRMHVPGYAGDEWVHVEDRGGAIQGARLDVLYPTHQEALRWGVRDLWVAVEVPTPEARP